MNVTAAPKADHLLQNIYNTFDAVPFAVAVLKGPSLVIEYINQYNLDIWQRSREEVLGKPLFEARPDLGATAETVHAEIYRSGQRFEAKEIRFDLDRNGKTEARYFDAVIDPVRDENGTIIGQLATSIDVTEKVVARKKVEESEQHLRYTIEYNAQVPWRADAAGNIEDFSERWLQLTGLAREEALGKGWMQVSHPGDVPAMTTAWMHSVATGAPYDIEHRIRLADGSYRWMRSRAQSRKDEAGNVIKWYGTTEDIHDRKLAEEALQESESKFRLLTNSLPLVVWTAAPDGGLTFISREWEESYGNKIEQSLGWGWASCVHPDDIKRAAAVWARALQTGGDYETEFRVRHKKDGYRWSLVRAVAIRNSKGSIESWYGSNTDIEEKKQAEEALQKQQRLYEAVTGGTPDLVYVFDLNYRFTYANPALLSMWGQTWEGAIGKGLRQLGYEEWHAAMHERGIDKVVATKKPIRGTVSFPHAELGKRIYDYIFAPVFNEKGDVIAIAGTTRDISDLKNAEERLKESEQELQRIFFQAPVSMVVYKGENLVVQVASQKALELWGKKEGDVIGRPFFDISPELREGQEPLFRQVRQTGEPFVGKEFPVQYVRNGEWHFIYYDFVFQPLRNADGEITAVVSIGTDVTHSVEARKKIEESESRFRSLAETLPQMVWMRDLQGKIEYASGAWLRYSGKENIDEAWQWMVHPDDWLPVMKHWESCYAGRRSFRHEVRLRNTRNEYRWHYATGEPVRNETGEVVKWIGSILDIHEQKTFSEKLENLVAERTQELHRSNDDLQQFAHVASHDLKEPVRKIRTFISRLQHEYEKDIPEPAKAYLHKMESASNRMYSMIDGVLHYSTLNATQQIAEPVNLNDTLRNIETDLEMLINQKEATVEYGELPTVQGAPILLHQLFYNLLNNALKFSKAGVPPQIKISWQKQKGMGAVKGILSKYENYAVINLQDNGIGFGSTEAEKIFGTFTRLNSKDQYEGTGLGLALCKKIVERHGGSIEAEGRRGEGATFTVVLPLAVE